MIERQEDNLHHNNNFVLITEIITEINYYNHTNSGNKNNTHKKYKLPSISIIAAASFEHSGIAQGSISVPNQ